MCADFAFIPGEHPTATNDTTTVVDNEHLERLIKIEANLLKFPLFALHTKGLKNLDGIECRGRLRRDGQVRDYVLRITRNTASLYPGPLSRRIHFALLSIATERGFPLKNPIAWTWRDLCRRMGISYGGKTTLTQLKAAIRASHGVVLHTEEALFSRPDRRPLPSLERGYHLYANYAFKNQALPNAGSADLNAVWFADWYLDNLNALHSAPLDYALWQSLDQRSSIASRLYEFLFLNFHSNSPLLRINYRNLAQLLPVKAESYLSDAQKQLQPALQLLNAAGVLGSADWTTGREQQIQLQFRRGPRLFAGVPKARRPAQSVDEPDTDEVEVRELRNTRQPEWFLVRDFHRLLTGDTDSLVKPTPKELALAHELIERHGTTKVHAILPPLVKQLKVKFPEAKTFGAAAYYLPEAIRDLERHEHLRQRENNERNAIDAGDEAANKERETLAALQVAWQNLPEAERTSIRDDVLARQPRGLAEFPGLIERFCLKELARRRELPVSTTTQVHASATHALRQKAPASPSALDPAA